MDSTGPVSLARAALDIYLRDSGVSHTFQDTYVEASEDHGTRVRTLNWRTVPEDIDGAVRAYAQTEFGHATHAKPLLCLAFQGREHPTGIRSSHA